MSQYIDGFALPVPRIHLTEYKSVAEEAAEIWKEYGALAYFEYVGEDLKLDGTRSSIEVLDLKPGYQEKQAMKSRTLNIRFV